VSALPQLRMRRRLADLPPVEVPAPYVLRNLTVDDVDAWRRLLARTGDLGEWTYERGARFFEPDSRMPLAGAFFLTWQGDAVATAQLHLHPDGPYAPLAELGWVAVDREHRGQGLARVVCLAVMHAAAEAGHAEMFLRTDDHRAAAIRTYLSLGFEPWMYDAAAPARWRKLMEEMAPR
jgi:GNAT superfamily N-acetyltransferase